MSKKQHLECETATPEVGGIKVIGNDYRTFIYFLSSKLKKKFVGSRRKIMRIAFPIMCSYKTVITMQD
jgi:hypothetical protein